MGSAPGTLHPARRVVILKSGVLRACRGGAEIEFGIVTTRSCPWPLVFSTPANGRNDTKGCFVVLTVVPCVITESVVFEH